MHKKSLFFLNFIFILSFSAVSQIEREFILRANLGIGADYNTLSYNNFSSSGVLAYSSGGGVGIELGLGLFPFKNTEVYSTLGIQNSLAMQYQSSTYGGTYKTSFSFFRTSLLLGANYNISIPAYSKLGLKVGGGGSYNIPGKMTMTEVNVDYGYATFHSQLGFHLELGATYKLKNWTICPSLRYRNLHLSNKTYVHQNTDSDFLSYVKSVNASGVDLSITFRKKLTSN